MQTWQTLSVYAMPNDSYVVRYLIGKKRKIDAIIRPTLGLEKAITGTGIMLANLPPDPDTRIVRN